MVERGGVLDSREAFVSFMAVVVGPPQRGVPLRLSYSYEMSSLPKLMTSKP